MEYSFATENSKEQASYPMQCVDTGTTAQGQRRNFFHLVRKLAFPTIFNNAKEIIEVQKEAVISIILIVSTSIRNIVLHKSHGKLTCCNVANSFDLVHREEPALI